MSAPVTEETVRALAPEPDDVWPEAERAAALAALLVRVGSSAPDLSDAAELAGADGDGAVGRRRWSWGAAVAAAVVVLLVGVAGVLVALHRSSSHDGVGPAATSSPSAAVEVPGAPIVIPLDHDGEIHYTSAPIPQPVSLTYVTAGGATYAGSGPEAVFLPAPDGQDVLLVLDFRVTSHNPGAYLEIDATYPVSSQIGPACQQSSGGCGAATEPGNVRPS